MINIIEAPNNDLKCINAKKELNNATIILMIEQRMSTAMHDKWIKIVIGTSHLERFETLLSFLENWKIKLLTFVLNHNPLIELLTSVLNLKSLVSVQNMKLQK